MKISELVKNLPDSLISGPQDVEVTGLYYDSRAVQAGGAFFALRGLLVDGHRYIDNAVSQGAVAVFMEEEHPLPENVAGVLVTNGRLAMARAAAAFYHDPTRDMPTVGVTGTNGKTTVTYQVEAILRAAGYDPAVLGTISYRHGQSNIAAPNTTPESVDLLRSIAGFKGDGADAVVMEVSSHALDQHRVDGVGFDVGVFTNLTPEHLDYHGTMEEYFDTKARFFSELLASRAKVINIDDPFGRKLEAMFPGSLTCGRSSDAQVRAVSARVSVQGIEAQIATPKGDFLLKSPMIGDFNLHNLLCAIGAGLALDIPVAKIAEALAAAPQVPGRLERVENDRGALILVDYAHTGDALEKVLETLVGLQPKRLITVFGCGGDRDRSKRPVMGKAAACFSDLAVVTSDNPRTEDPLVILDEIREGVRQVHAREWSAEEGRTIRGRGFVTIADRAAAIAYAVSLLEEGDLLLVAGKGHEDYQIVGHQRFHFDDREELRRALKGVNLS